MAAKLSYFNMSKIAIASLGFLFRSFSDRTVPIPYNINWSEATYRPRYTLNDLYQSFCQFSLYFSESMYRVSEGKMKFFRSFLLIE